MSNYKHGMTNTSEYRQWTRMLQKCQNYNDRDYAKYGMKNITVCEEWLDFKNFYSWLKNNGRKKHSVVHLKEGSKQFSPKNCLLKHKNFKTKGE